MGGQWVGGQKGGGGATAGAGTTAGAGIELRNVPMNSEML